jgi:hypothetical protein
VLVPPGAETADLGGLAASKAPSFCLSQCLLAAALAWCGKACVTAGSSHAGAAHNVVITDGIIMQQNLGSQIHTVKYAGRCSTPELSCTYSI